MDSALKQTRNRKTIALLIIAMAIVGGCAAPRYTFNVVAPAKYAEKVDSVHIREFSTSSNSRYPYAYQLKKLIEAGIANEGYISVVNGEAECRLEGTLDIGGVQTHKYTTKTQKDNKTVYTYHFTKKLVVAGSFTMASQRRNKTLVGDSFTEIYNKSWSSDESYALAMAEAPPNEEIIHLLLKRIACDIVATVSPHRETVSRVLQAGENPNIKLGNTYLKNGRMEQAVGIWDQVIHSSQTPEDKAAAIYNIGVVKEAQGRYQDAFDLFSRANKLVPSEELYIQAMTRVENAQKQREKAQFQTE